jgi:fructose-bisphosphate aldolase class II
LEVPIKFVLDYAKEKNFMLSRFLVTNLESIEALTNAAISTQSPFLYDIYFPLMERSCLGCVEELARRFINSIDLPTGLFADHVESVEGCIAAIDRGYSGVMIDLSKLSLKENIKGSREVVDYAHKRGIFVEGEVGIITRSPKEEVVETDPQEAIEYVQKAGVDCLAISVGVYSGFYEGEPDINYNLISQLAKLKVHLCLHGASGLSREIMQRCISLGMHFTGYGTDPLYKFFKKIDEVRKKKGERFIDPSRIMIPARDEIQKEIEEKVYFIKSNGRAGEILNLYKNINDASSELKVQVQSPVYSCEAKELENFLINKNIDIESLIRKVTAEVLRRIENKK